MGGGGGRRGAPQRSGGRAGGWEARGQSASSAVCSRPALAANEIHIDSASRASRNNDLRQTDPSEGQPGREDMGHERDKAFTGFLAAGVATVGSGPNQTWDRGLRTSGNGHPQRSGSESPSSRLSSSPRLRLRRQNSSTQAFARTHPVTGRCTYSTPAVNKAARAMSRARGGQVLLADLQCGVAGSDSGAQNRSIWKTSGRSGTSSISDLSASTDSALQVPPELTVATPAGPARTSLRTLGRAPLRGFPEAVPMAELVAELPPPPPLSRPQGGA